MDNDTLPDNDAKKREKFLFNMNHFDVEDEEEDEIVEDLPPPPPTFSEEELALAKAQAFEEGKQQGLKEAAASREQALAQTMNLIAAETVRLFADEATREGLYEEESVRLALAIFNKLFPHTAKKHGFEELKAAMNAVLSKTSGHSVIGVLVSENMVEGVEAFLASLSAKEETLNFKVTADPQMNDQSCKLVWDDGGFIRDTDAMALEIQTILASPLAGEAAKGHDIESSTDAPSDADTPQNDPESMEKPDE